MSLQNKLNDMRKQFESGAPPEVLAIMHRATDDLKNSGIMQNVLKKGDKAPDFTLVNQKGESVSSSEILNRGPLVIGFYRGVW